MYQPTIIEAPGYPYGTVHLTLMHNRGAASTHPCVDCGEQADDWSLSKDAADVQISHEQGRPLKYSKNLADYDPRCSSCHARYDGFKFNFTR